MSYSIVLLTPRLISLRNTLKGNEFLKRMPLVLIGLLFWWLIYIGSYKTISYIREIEFLGDMLSRKFLSMTFFSLTGFLLLSNMITAISTFYLSRDIPFLMTLPVRTGDILIIKTVETIVESSWMAMTFIPPVFFAYGAAYKASLMFYIVTVLSILLFIMLTSGSGILLAHVLTRLFPAKRTRDMLLLAGLGFFVTVYMVVRMAAPKDIEKPEELVNTILNFKMESPFLPSFWLSEIVWKSLKSGLDINIVYVLPLVSSAFFFMMIAHYSGLWLYRTNMEAIRPKSEKTSLSRYYPTYKYALIYKDSKLFFRDTSQWSQMLITGALLFIYVYNFKMFPIDSLRSITPLILEIVVLVNLLMAGLVLSAVAARFIYPSVSLEGQAFWLIQSSPINLRTFMYNKLIFGFVPVTTVTFLLVLFTNLALGIHGALMFASLSIVLLLCISICGLGTGFSAMYPKFRYENLAQVSMSLSGMTFMLLSMGVAVFTIVAGAVPFYLYYKNGHIVWTGTFGALILISIVNFTAIYLPIRLGIENLRRIE